MRAAAALLLVVGVLAVTESALTAVWQEPITALLAHRQQSDVGGPAGENPAGFPRGAAISVGTRPDVAAAVAALAARLESRTGAGDALGRIRIPKLDVRFVFVAGAGSKSLKKGPGHYDSTALPGQNGTVGLAGHRTTYLAPFRKLDRLRRGDEIAVTMPYGRFSYTVKGSRVVSPSGIAVLVRWAMIVWFSRPALPFQRGEASRDSRHQEVAGPARRRGRRSLPLPLPAELPSCRTAWSACRTAPRRSGRPRSPYGDVFTTPSPKSCQRPLRMFLRCAALFIQARIS